MRKLGTLFLPVAFFVALGFLLASSAHSADFCVTNAGELQGALSAAGTSGAENTVRIVQGSYVGNFTYSSANASALKIEGGYVAGCGSRAAEPRSTVLDGGGVASVLAINDASGGLIQIAISELTIQNGYGHGLSLQSARGSLLLSGTLIRNNVGPGEGGGVSISGFSTISINGNVFVSNTSNSKGGGIYLGSSTVSAVTVQGNSFSSNVSVRDGGAMFFQISASATLGVVGNVISNNAAGDGHSGGAYLNSVGTTNLINNTIVGNSALAAGAGVTIYYARDANVFNNILWNNTGPSARDILFAEVMLSGVSFFSNDVDQTEQGVGGLGAFIFDPSNLNAVDPHFSDTTNEDYHLQPTSPCLDAGSLAAPQLPSVDLDGLPRIVNSIVDMGAYEYQGTLPAPSSPDLFGLLDEFLYYKLEERVKSVFQVRNRGTKASGFNAACYVSSVPATVGTLVDSVSIKPGLAASATKGVTCAFSSAESLSGKYLQLVIDPDDAIWESVETNNRVIVRIP